MNLRGAALRAGLAVAALAGCARTPLPFSEAEDASLFGPIAPFDAGLDPGGGFGTGPGDADAGTLPIADLTAACGADPDFSLAFKVADDGPSGEPRSDAFTGFLSQVEPGLFVVKLEDRVATFGLTRPSGATIPFGAGERITVAYRVDPDATTWALTLSGDEGPRYAARSGRAELTDTLLGLGLRGVRTDCPNRYIGDCIDAQEAVVVLEDSDGRTTALGSGGRAWVNAPEHGPVLVIVHAAIDDRDACAPRETWGLFVALEMDR